MKFDLQIKGDLENVQEFVPSPLETFEWHMKFKCAGCGEEKDTYRVISLNDTSGTKLGRGEAHLVETCQFCRHANNASIVGFEKAVGIPYTESDDGTFKTVCTFDCRGLEPTGFRFGGGYRIASSKSKTVFNDVTFEDNEWTDYDEEGKESISVLNLEYRFVRRK
ncbi:hypothetical protein RvY_15676 [Ramazzottius varieornatus]|uniref:DUF866 domain-containing protein n=1 Tax=Ramazzottius varieornatus TaxID=947166 RepID=A0A1D1VVS7_RAMVA|nr:hypothetical protein RvY_15676 [Ramazzottius varieornatus]